MADPKSYLSQEKDPLNIYVKEHSFRKVEALERLQEETKKLGKKYRMLVDPMEAQFLRFLLKVSGAKRCLEIGTFTGYNACSVALTIPDDGEVIALDINETFINHGKEFWPEECAKKIKVKFGPAVESLDKMIAEGEAGTFDFVFIDADKPNYDNYYEKGLVLLKKGGIIAVDNALWNGKVTGNPAEFEEETKALDTLNKKIKADERVEVSFLTVGDGTYLACKK